MLYVVATPIGPDDQLSSNAVQAIQSADLVIGEEPKVLRQWLKQAGVFKETRLLNEHSLRQDLAELVDLCGRMTVALVSDCGTPNFCDPGADLVRACRKAQISVKSVAGPSSLTSFLSVCGYRLDQFYFAGFLPKERTERESFWKQLSQNKSATLLMDTPYRLDRVLAEAEQTMPKRNLVIGVRLSHPDERVLEGRASSLREQLTAEKAEFILLVLP